MPVQFWRHLACVSCVYPPSPIKETDFYEGRGLREKNSVKCPLCLTAGFTGCNSIGCIKGKILKITTAESRIVVIVYNGGPMNDKMTEFSFGAQRSSRNNGKVKRGVSIGQN